MRAKTHGSVQGLCSLKTHLNCLLLYAANLCSDVITWSSESWERNLLTDTGGVCIVSIWVKGVFILAHSWSARDRSANRCAPQAVSSTT